MFNVLSADTHAAVRGDSLRALCSLLFDGTGVARASKGEGKGNNKGLPYRKPFCFYLVELDGIEPTTS
jgi:hypothetical protein